MSTFWIVTLFAVGIIIVAIVAFLLRTKIGSNSEKGSRGPLVNCPHCGKQTKGPSFSSSGTAGFVTFEVKEVRCSHCRQTFIASKQMG